LIREPLLTSRQWIFPHRGFGKQVNSPVDNTTLANSLGLIDEFQNSSVGPCNLSGKRHQKRKLAGKVHHIAIDLQTTLGVTFQINSAIALTENRQTHKVLE